MAVFLSGLACALVAAAVIAKLFFIGQYRIPQNGMYPGLPAGSLLFTLKRAYASASEVRRGDIIIFVREENGQRYNYIWRVIALPGELIETSGESLVIDGQKAQRRHLRVVSGSTIYQEKIGETAFEVAFNTSPRQLPPDAVVKVPPGHFFVMGDNRFDALDSRYFGPVAFSAIIGKSIWAP